MFNIGDVCKLKDQSFLWVPFMQCLSRRGEVLPSEDKFNFVAFPGGVVTRFATRNEVYDVYLDRDEEKAAEFWRDKLCITKPASEEFVIGSDSNCNDGKYWESKESRKSKESK